ncbi:MAG TPA: hypothetical protein ENK85_04005 [Saprospiraceae bacterium]|nr:hypothetical protein [Saprospiraceae bacterium]
MESTKILKSLRKLDYEHRKRFRLYLQSPYFNRSKTFLKAFDVLSGFIDKYPDKKLSKEKYWKKVFGKESYKEVNLRKLNSDLLRIFKNFLAQEQYQKDEGRKINYLMKAVHNLGIDDLQSISIRQSDKYFEETPYRNADYYLQRYTKEKEYYQLIDFDKDREAKSNVEEILRNLDLFYISEKLYFYTSSIVRSKILSHDYQLFLIDEILEYLRQTKNEKVTAVAIYYYLASAISDISKVDAFVGLKYLIETEIHLFPVDEAIQIYSGALNYAVAKLNSGAFEFNKEYVDLIKQMIEKNYILEKDGYIALHKFRNTCMGALRIEEFEWTEWFIQEYGKKLHPDIRESAINFTLALLHFRKKQFGKVVPLLSMIEYDDVAFGLAAKTLLGATYYELDEFDALESHIDAFKVFLSRRKDIPEVRRKNYLIYLKYLSRLIRLIPGDKKQIDKFVADIEAEGRVINSEFLLEKAEELR